MDTSIKNYPEQDLMQALEALINPSPQTKWEPYRKIVGYKCTADGKHFAEFSEKRCRYCLPIYEDEK